MQLVYFLVVIISLACGSAPADDGGLLFPIIATSATVAFWGILCHFGARSLSTQVLAGQLEPRVGASWIERQLEWMRWLSLAVVCLCLIGFKLAGNLRTTPVFESSMFLQSLILLAPGLILMLANWSAEQAYGVRLNYTDRGFANHLKSLWISFRSGLGWLVAPVLALLAVADLVSLMPFRETLVSAITIALLLGFVLFGMPIAIRRLFKTEPIDDELAGWIQQVLQAAGMKRIRCVRWNTGGLSFNALIAGFIGRHKTMLISDRILDDLDREEIAMVILHEAAHVRRHHVMIRILAVLPAWIAGMMVTSIAADSAWSTSLGTLAAILFTVLLLRIVSYRTEFDADATACKLAIQTNGTVADVPICTEQASQSMITALMKVTSGSAAARKASWLHPGVSDRVDSLRCQADAPQPKSTTAGTIANPA